MRIDLRGNKLIFKLVFFSICDFVKLERKKSEINLKSISLQLSKLTQFL